MQFQSAVGGKLNSFLLSRYLNEIEATYERAHVKVERGSTFTLTRDLPNIVSGVKFTCVRIEK